MHTTLFSLGTWGLREEQTLFHSLVQLKHPRDSQQGLPNRPGAGGSDGRLPWAMVGATAIWSIVISGKRQASRHPRAVGRGCQGGEKTSGAARRRTGWRRAGGKCARPPRVQRTVFPKIP